MGRARHLVVNQCHRPEVEATANLLADRCEAGAADYEVTVLTGRPPEAMLGPTRPPRASASPHALDGLGPREPLAAEPDSETGRLDLDGLGLRAGEYVERHGDPPAAVARDGRRDAELVAARR